MKRYIGSVPTAFTQATTPTKFKTNNFVTFNDGSSSIGCVVYPLIAQRAYGITYKYLIKVDIDVYIANEEDLTLHELSHND